MGSSFLLEKGGLLPSPHNPPQPLFFSSYTSSMWQNAATSSSLSSDTSNNSWPLATAWGRETTFKRRAATQCLFPQGTPFPLLPDLMTQL